MAQNPVKATGGFVAFLARHWILSAVLLVVIALFAASPIRRLVSRVPFLAKYAGGEEA